MLFENDYDYDVNFKELSSYKNNISNILNPYESFIRGNSFNDLYDSYKNYTYIKLKSNNKKESLLFEIMSLCFIINDLNLYLDLHSDDKETFNLFKKYIEEEKRLEEKYKKEYGSLTLEDTTGETYTWLNNMPWDSMRGDIYV